MIEVRVDEAQLEEVRRQLDYLHNGVERALSRALNKTASKAKTVASKAIRSQINLLAAYVRERLKGPANGWEYKATVQRLTAKLSTPKRGILMKEFATNPVAALGRPPAPIKVKVKAGGPTKTLWSAFWVRTRGSNVITPAIRNAVLIRLGHTGPLDRGEFTVLHGPSLSQVFTDVKDDISTDMNAVLAANLFHEMDWLLQKYPPPPDDGVEPEV